MAAPFCIAHSHPGTFFGLPGSCTYPRSNSSWHSAIIPLWRQVLDASASVAHVRAHTGAQTLSTAGCSTPVGSSPNKNPHRL